MNITRALLAAAVTVALVVGCGSDDGGGSNIVAKLVSCHSDSSAQASACGSCYQSKCASELKKCFGDDFNGGPCASYSSCLNKASDACKGQCAPNEKCVACLMGDLLTCQNDKCAKQCGTNGAGADSGANGA